jgi:hypothetical protein
MYSFSWRSLRVCFVSFWINNIKWKKRRNKKKSEFVFLQRKIIVCATSKFVRSELSRFWTQKNVTVKLVVLCKIVELLTLHLVMSFFLNKTYLVIQIWCANVANNTGYPLLSSITDSWRKKIIKAVNNHYRKLYIFIITMHVIIMTQQLWFISCIIGFLFENIWSIFK